MGHHSSAVIAASCCVGHICMVGGGGGCSCTLLLHPVLTIADAGPDLCTLCPDLCTLYPDLRTLCLWCFPSFNWCKHSICTGGGCHQLQLMPVVLFYSATSADSSLAHVVVSASATCAGGEGLAEPKCWQLASLVMVQSLVSFVVCTCMLFMCIHTMHRERQQKELVLNTGWHLAP